MPIRKAAKDSSPQAPLDDSGASFLRRAADAGAYQNPAPKFARVRAGRKIQVSFAIPEAMLDAVEKHASAMGQSRAFVFNLAVVEYLRAKGIAPPGV